MSSLEMEWLPPSYADLAARLRLMKTSDDHNWMALVAQAGAKLDGMAILQLDRTLRRLFPEEPPSGLATKPIRLALLGTSTLDHLAPALRVGALRHGLWLQVRVGEYGQCSLDGAGEGADTVLFAHDARHLVAGFEIGMSAAAATDRMNEVCDDLVDAWRKAKAKGCSVLQQAVLPLFPCEFGNNEHRLPGSKAASLEMLNVRLRTLADLEGVDLIAVDRQSALDGLYAWHDRALWHRAKQEIHPRAAPIFGEIVARLLAARQGRSRKALVLDLDNTLWGGVVGDDGVEGIVLGQGSALGEAFVDVQRYARDLSRRGIVLAVCSKNDEQNALEPFEKHPDMVLRRADIACFVANWTDKAANLREIASQLNLGLDALVFLDDNPAERALVRSELPEVAVPELPDDPADYAQRISEAGYFEGLRPSKEDFDRTEQYQANLRRAKAAQSHPTNLGDYLTSLDMVLQWGPLDTISASRVVQLVNKSNQFNLTTRRTTDAALASIIIDPLAFTLQLRLVDRFGDNGLICVVIGERHGDVIEITDWLMSCRVLKRGVEQATLNIIVAESRRLGATQICGMFRPTAKNSLVRDHYQALGFSPLEVRENGATRWSLKVNDAKPITIYMRIEPPIFGDRLFDREFTEKPGADLVTID
jgi:FkbH-like protein